MIAAAPSSLVDPQGRTVDYLRISITDRCNERCLYCLPEQFQGWLPREEVLGYDELLEVARAAHELGFRRFRVTGGEPLIRPGVADFVADLAALPGAEVALTTNGTRLAALAPLLAQAGLRSVNVSLDALDAERYHAITNGDVRQVFAGLDAARAAGIPIKLNTVLIRHRNEDQLVPILDFAAEHGYPVRFIELMPVSLTEMLSEENFLPIAEVRRFLEKVDELDPIEAAPELESRRGPARYFRLRRRGSVVGFIGALTEEHFCGRCNKMRITCDGKLRPCLGNHLEQDLKPGLRPAFDRALLRDLFTRTLAEKPAEHIFLNNYQPDRVMTAIGG